MNKTIPCDPINENSSFNSNKKIDYQKDNLHNFKYNSSQQCPPKSTSNNYFSNSHSENTVKNAQLNKDNPNICNTLQHSENIIHDDISKYLGTLISVETIHGEVLKGEFFCHDFESLNSIILREANDDNTFGIRFIQINAIKKISTHRLPNPQNNLSLPYLNKNSKILFEKQKIKEFEEKKKNTIGIGVDLAAQELFDLIAKTHPDCVWKKNEISVMGVLISPPYNPENCQSKDLRLKERIQLVVKRFREKNNLKNSQKNREIFDFSNDESQISNYSVELKSRRDDMNNNFIDKSHGNYKNVFNGNNNYKENVDGVNPYGCDIVDREISDNRNKIFSNVTTKSENIDDNDINISNSCPGKSNFRDSNIKNVLGTNTQTDREDGVKSFNYNVGNNNEHSGKKSTSSSQTRCGRFKD